MPIRIQNDLPAKAILESENIFVMDEKRANTQDIRYGNTALKSTFQHAVTGRLYFFDDRVTSKQEYKSDSP